MGLDISLDTWHGAYSLFGRWRAYLASLAGYHVIQSWKTNGERCLHCGLTNDDFTHPHICIDWTMITDAELMGDWAETPDDPLLVLIAHADTDGQIAVRDAGPLADRLEQVLPRINDASSFVIHSQIRARTEQFIKGLRQAVTLNRPLVFA